MSVTPFAKKRIRHESIEPWHAKKVPFATTLDWLKALPLANLVLFASLVGSIQLGLYCVSVRYFPLDDLGSLAGLVLVFFGPGVLLLVATAIALAQAPLAGVFLERQFPALTVDVLDIIVPPFVALGFVLWRGSLNDPSGISLAVGAVLLVFAVPLLEFQLVYKPLPWLRAVYHVLVAALSLFMLLLIFQIIDRHLDETAGLLWIVMAVSRADLRH